MKVTVCDGFTFKNIHLNVGTELEITGVVDRPEAMSKLAFIVSKCNKQPKLVGHTVCTSLIANSKRIIEQLQFKESYIEPQEKTTINKKLLLII